MPHSTGSACHPEPWNPWNAANAPRPAAALLRYRHGRPEPDVAGRVVIVVDDGLATGVTARAALLEIEVEQYLTAAAAPSAR